MIVPKRSKPAAEHHKPVALTNSEMRERNDLQVEFMRGRRMENNLFMLDYGKKKLIVMAVDFEKAFNSVDRYLIGAMKR